MEKKKCKTCGKSFEAKRADSIYCSSACKQQAHQKRVVQKLDDKTNVFYMSEFERMEIDSLDLITFCFLRKNFEPNANTDSISNFIFSMVKANDSRDFYFDYGKITNTKAYSEFKERFLSGEFKVLDKKEVASPN